MKRTLALLLVLLALGALPAQAQDGGERECSHDLTNVYLFLGEAQGAWELGDHETAVEALTNAREALTLIEIACGGPGPQEMVVEAGTPTPAPTMTPQPTATPEPDDAVVMYVAGAGGAAVNVTDVKQTAQTEGVPVRIYDDQREFILALADPYVIGAIYGGPGITNEGLRALQVFVEDGGRVLLLYDESWTAQNTLLQELFGITVSAATLGIQKNTDFVYPRSMLPSWLSSYTIGIAAQGADLTGFFRAMLTVPPTWPGERGTVPDPDTAQEVLVYYGNPTGTVTFWPVPVTLGSGDLLYFFADEHVGYFYNRQAFFDMVNYLLSGSQ